MALYGFDLADVFAGKAPVRVALVYIQRLPFEPRSLWRAMQLGGVEHMEWSRSEYLLADIIDQIAVNTVITGHMGAKGKPKLPEPTYRPDIVTRDDQKVVEIEDFNVFAMVEEVENGYSN